MEAKPSGFSRHPPNPSFNHRKAQTYNRLAPSHDAVSCPQTYYHIQADHLLLSPGLPYTSTTALCGFNGSIVMVLHLNLDELEVQNASIKWH